MEASPKNRKSSSRLRVAALGGVAVLIGTLLTGCVGSAAGTAATQKILVSRSVDRANPSSLHGATLKGVVYVFLSSPDSVKKAEFFLDDPAMAGTPRQIDRWAPFDFAGTEHRGRARAFRTSEIPDGTHEVTARLTLDGGARKRVSARFRVGNRTGSTTTPTTVATPPTTQAPPATPPATTAPPSTPTAPPGGFPTPATTGWAHTGVSLTRYTGPCTINTDGTTIDKADIGCDQVIVNADDVTISRSRITASSHYGILSWGARLTVTDTEVTGTATTAIASWGDSGTFERVLSHNTKRGMQIGSGDRVVDSYFDDYKNDPGGIHANAILSNGAVSNVVISGNQLGCGTYECTAAISAFPEPQWGPNSNWTIEGNLLNGGAYCVFLGYTPSKGEQPNTYFRVTNNVFGNKYHTACGIYGPVATWTPPPTGVGNAWIGNTYAGGRPVNEPGP